MEKPKKLESPAKYTYEKKEINALTQGPTYSSEIKSK